MAASGHDTSGVMVFCFYRPVYNVESGGTMVMVDILSRLKMTESGLISAFWFTTSGC